MRNSTPENSVMVFIVVMVESLVGDYCRRRDRVEAAPP